MLDKELELKEESNLVLAMLTKKTIRDLTRLEAVDICLLYTSPSPRD